MDLREMIERQCDNMATGTQMPEFLRGDYGEEPELRELLRKNLEQLADALLARVRRELLDELALLDTAWNIHPGIDGAEILDRLSDALDRICPREHPTLPAQEAGEPADTSAPAPRS